MRVGIALFDQNASYRVCQLWVRLNLVLYGVRVTTRRLVPLDPSRAYVVMSNHRSQFDILGCQSNDRLALARGP